MARNNHPTEYAVIGLGRFGSSVALTLTGLGYNVLGIDRDRDIVQQLADQLAQTVALDATNEDALRQVDITSYETVIVAIGSNFEANLLTTVSLKSMGVRTVICKALSERQKTILLRVGADRVILPEHEAGCRLGYELAIGSLDRIELGSTHSVAEFRAPASLAGRSLRQAGLDTVLGVNVLAVKRGEALTMLPPPDYVLQADDVLVVGGSNDDISRLSELE
ncbi:MAG: TrkA family potassium uptake protein [Anaerolineae bacterium]|nr:TrkA family potassium uptake protein [Thermoflexales bacterium]MDW8408276.1 TrkA family potassium uptake protein [Anaerolineae bacterium]